MDGHAVLVPGRIGVGMIIGYSLCSHDIGVSGELAAKFEQTGTWGYFKSHPQQIAPHKRPTGGLETETA